MRVRSSTERRAAGGPAPGASLGQPSPAPCADEPAGDAGAEVDEEERGARLDALQSLIDMMRPAVQSDGGDLVLVSADVVSGVVEVELQGACSSCAVSSSTLQAGVERVLTQRLPWVRQVRGGVDETMGWADSFSLGRGGYVPRA